MNRKEATTKAAELLLTDKNRNANFYYSLFEKFSYLDTESIPISPIKMPNVAKENIVILSDEAYYNLMGIRDITDQTEEEVPFFILGEEKPDGKIYLDTVLSNNKPTGRGEADFSELNEILNIYVNKVVKGEFNNGNKQVIVHGHTHGNGFVSDNFSFGDLISYVEFNDLHPIFKNRQVETMGMLMPPSGDFNFIFYENNPVYEGFYTVPDVYVSYSNGLNKKLPAYENGNYLVNNYRYDR